MSNKLDSFLARLPTPPHKRRAKTPTVIQMEMVECGAAALGIVLGYHGLFVPLEELRVTCGVSRDGSKASNVVKAARKYGMVAKGYRRTPESAREMTFPAIVHWNFNHFLVVEGFHKDIVYLNDPASGPRTVSAEEFDEAFTGVILTFEKGEEFQKGGRKNNVLPSLIKRLRGSSEALIFVVLASLALVIPGLLIPTFSRIFVDSYLVDGRTEWILPLIIGMGVTALLRAILTWLQQRYLLRLETKLALTTSGQLVWHILRLPMEFFTQRSAGDISSRIRSNDRVAKLLSGELATTALNSILIIFYATLMWLYSPLLTVIGATIAGFNGIVLRYVSRKRVDINQKMIQDQAKLIGTSFSGLQSIETIKATGREDDFFARWAGYQTKLVNAKQELGVFTQIVMVVPTFLASLATALVLIVGGYNVIAGTMTIGMLVAFQSLMTSFLTPVTQIVMMSTQVQEIEGIMNRLDDVHKYKPDPQADVIPTAPSATQTHKLSGTVQLRNLSFGYNRLAKPLIEDFNLDLQPGMRVAFVGPSGSGKSTLARLISGLYTPWGGDILFDQQPRSEIPRSVLNRSLAMVDQDIFLFEGTIQDNLTLWDDNVPEQMIVQAAKDAAIHDDITTIPSGYAATVEEGGRNFSGGQRQRLEIARSLVTNPAILVLDEATSALDPVTEKIIDDNLRQRGCTCIIVAHRLSTIRDCDEIIVLDKGKVVQRGTHEQLWRQKGVYAKLIKAETPKSELLVDSLWEAVIT